MLLVVSICVIRQFRPSASSRPYGPLCVCVFRLCVFVSSLHQVRVFLRFIWFVVACSVRPVRVCSVCPCGPFGRGFLPLRVCVCLVHTVRLFPPVRVWSPRQVCFCVSRPSDPCLCSLHRSVYLRFSSPSPYLCVAFVRSLFVSRVCLVRGCLRPSGPCLCVCVHRSSGPCFLYTVHQVRFLCRVRE